MPVAFAFDLRPEIGHDLCGDIEIGLGGRRTGDREVYRTFCVRGNHQDRRGVLAACRAVDRGVSPEEVPADSDRGISFVFRKHDHAAKTVEGLRKGSERPFLHSGASREGHRVIGKEGGAGEQAQRRSRVVEVEDRARRAGEFPVAAGDRDTLCIPVDTDTQFLQGRRGEFCVVGKEGTDDRAFPLGKRRGYQGPVGVAL